MGCIFCRRLGVVGRVVLMKKILLAILLSCCAIFTSISMVSAQEMPVLSPALAEVQNAIVQNDMEKANSLLEQQIASGEAIPAWLIKAQIAMVQRNPEGWNEAIENAQKLIEADKKNMEWYAPLFFVRSMKAFQEGNLEQAKSEIMSAHKIVSASSYKNKQWEAFINFFAAYLERKDNNTHARKYAEKSIDLYDSLKMKHEQAHATFLLAELEWDRNKERRAYKAYDEALDLLKDAKAPGKCMAEVYIRIAQRQLSEGNPKVAESQLKLAEQVLGNLADSPDLAKIIQQVRAKIAENQNGEAKAE